MREDAVANHRNKPEQRTARGSFWDKIWKDENGQKALYQRPNILIIAWAVCHVAAVFAPSRKVADGAWIVGTIALLIWALLELFKGVNYFRRVLGLIVLLITVASIFKISP